MRHSYWIALLFALATLGISPKATFACSIQGFPDRMCCLGERNLCLGHCVEISTCDDADDGYEYCGEGGGLCCNTPYSTHNPEGGKCTRPPRVRRESITLKSDYDRVAELVLVPDFCARRYRVRELAPLGNPTQEPGQDYPQEETPSGASSRK